MKDNIVKERPILFTPWSVSRILPGDKTQTRRVIKNVINPENLKVVDRMIYHRPEDREGNTLLNEWREWKPMTDCRHGTPGSHLWIREPWAITYEEWEEYQTENGPEGNRYPTVYDGKRPTQDLLETLTHAGLCYQADYLTEDGPLTCNMAWRKSMFMPRWASRVLLKLDEVRVERVQEITEEDAMAEGIEIELWDMAVACRDYRIKDGWFQGWDDGLGWPYVPDDRICRESFHTLWDSINAKRGHGWDVNPWVNALTFHVVERRNR